MIIHLSLCGMGGTLVDYDDLRLLLVEFGFSICWPRGVFMAKLLRIEIRISYFLMIGLGLSVSYYINWRHRRGLWCLVN